jgi:hypothetical protein
MNGVEGEAAEEIEGREVDDILEAWGRDRRMDQKEK